jgi:Flp pilus assembly protein CpaB
MKRAGHAADERRTFPFEPAPISQSQGGPASPSSRRVLYGVVIAGVALALIALKVSQASKTRLVLSVKAPVQVGQVLTAGDLGETSLPANSAIPSLPASRRAQVIGQTAQAPLYPGDVLDPQEVNTVAALPAGAVAMTIALTPEQAVGGTLHPGENVAVFAASSTAAAGAAPTATEVLGGVPVRAVNAQMTTGGPTTEFVTLQLTVAQATDLEAVYRGQQAKIDLALVGS